MTTFTITITDQAQLDGLAAARAAYNAEQPRDDQGAPTNQIATDEAYLQDRAADMLASYAQHFGTLTRTITAAQAVALKTVLARAADAGVEGAAEMVVTAGEIIG